MYRKLPSIVLFTNLLGYRENWSDETIQRRVDLEHLHVDSSFLNEKQH